MNKVSLTQNTCAQVLDDETSLLEKIHDRYEQAGFDGPADVVSWLEGTYRMGMDPIPALNALMAGVCDVILAMSGDGKKYKTAVPTLLAWLDPTDVQLVLEIRD
jgi:hypothetical protein